MTFGKFKTHKNALKISVSGVEQMTHIIGPLKLGENCETNKKEETSRECNKRREVSGVARFSNSIRIK